MANSNPGAKSAIAGLFLGILTAFGGPVGLGLGLIAGASAYQLGRAIGRRRNASDGQGNNYKNHVNYEIPLYNRPKNDTESFPLLSTEELLNLTRPTISNREYNNTNSQVNSISDISGSSSDEWRRITRPIRPDHRIENLYTRINAIADNQHDHDDEPDEPRYIQKQTRRRTRIDEYGQIWEE